MWRTSLLSAGFIVGSLATAVLTDAATSPQKSTKLSNSAKYEAALSVENVDDKIFNVKGIGKRCVEKNQVCRFYYRGYYYETPWWTAPEIY